MTWRLTGGRQPYIATLSSNWRDVFHWLFKHDWHWYDFTLIRASIRRDIVNPGLEIQFALLGFGIFFRYNFAWDGSPAAKALADFEVAHPEFATERGFGEEELDEDGD